MRELSEQSVRDQTEAFLAYMWRQAGRERMSMFKHWSACKDFTPEDREAIRHEVQAMLLARTA